MSTPQNFNIGTFLRDQRGRLGRRIATASKGRPVTRASSKNSTAATSTLEEFSTPRTEFAADYSPDNSISEEIAPVQIDLEPAAIQTQEPAMAGPQVKLVNFAGEPGEKGGEWYKRYKSICCSMYQYTEAKVKATFVFYLVGQALAWYNSLPENVKDDPDDVYTAFLQRFDGSDAGFALGTIKQRASETVSDYYTRFLDVTNNQGMPLSWLIATFVDGLFNPIRRIVKPQELSSLEAARRAAIRAEHSVNDTVEVSAVGATASDAKMDQLVTMMAQLCNKLDNQMLQPQQQQRHQGRQDDRTWSHRRHEHQNRGNNYNNRQGRNHFVHTSRENFSSCKLCLKNHKTDDCPDIVLASRL